MLRFILFGTPAITRDAAPVRVERRKSRMLLYYLADRGGPVTREELLALFWVDIERPQALQVLRTTLHGLNRALGDDLQVDREWVSLAGEVQVDTRQFAAALAASGDDVALLAEAIGIYRGDFLSGVNLSQQNDAPEVESWLVARREHYRRLYARAARQLGSLYERQGAYRQALAVLDGVLATDPLQEDVQREQIRLLTLAGDRPAAIRRYDELRRLLDEELGVPPMAETRALYDQIISDRLPAAPVPSVPRAPLAPREPRDARGTLPFTGRESELVTLGDGLFSGRLNLIEGEAGIGKTRLARHFLSGLNAFVLNAAAHELEQALPYQPVIAALRNLTAQPDWPGVQDALRAQLPEVWLSEVARLLPELRPAGMAAYTEMHDEWRIWQGVHQLLVSVSQSRPVVLFLDDLQWADPSTLNLLGYCIRQPARGRIGFLATTRPFAARSPLGSLVFALVREGRLVRLPLERFSPGVVRQIAREISPQAPPEFGEWLLRQTEGNPYMLAETVQDARRQNILRPDGSLDLERMQRGPLVPPTVYSLIQSRLSQLSEPAQRLLNVAVALGRTFAFDLAARAAGLSEDRALDALDELLKAGLVYPGEPAGHYRFDHSLTMEVAYREAGEVRHRRTHRHVAEAMLAQYGPARLENMAGLVAFHFLEGNEPRGAAPFAVKAARQAENLSAWREAAFFLRGALDGSQGWERYPLLIELGRVQLAAGELSQSTETFREALHLAETSRRPAAIPEARLMLAASLLPQARFGEAIQAIEALAQQSQAASVVCEAELQWGTALSLEGSDLAGAEEHLRRAAQFCADSARPELKAQVLFELGSVAAQRGDLPLAILQYRQALDAATPLTSAEGIQRRVLANNNLAYHLHLLGDAQAESYARAGLALSEQYGKLGLQPYLYSTLGEIALAEKRYAEAGEAFESGLALARQMNMPERVAGITANLGRLAAAQGKTDVAIHRLSAAMSQADGLGTRHLAAQIRLWLAPLLPVAEGRGLLREARAIAEAGGRRRLLDEIDAALGGIPIV